MDNKNFPWQETVDGKRPLTDAVKALRLALGDTQHRFANRLGLAISTVVRYETNRPPKGKALAQLLATAESNELFDLTHAFKFALAQDLQVPVPTRDGEPFMLPSGEVRVRPKNQEEQSMTRALLRFLRSDRSRPGWKGKRRQIKKLLGELS